MDGGLGVKIHAAENAAEPEKVLVFKPCGAGMLVNLHAEPVAGFPDVGGQVKIRGGEAVLGVAHKAAVEPDIEGLFHPLEGDADPLPQKPRLQIKTADVAAHVGILPVDFRGPEFLAAIPGVEGIDILDFPVALEFHMPRHPDGAKGPIVKIFLPEPFRPLPGVAAPCKIPDPV